ncbi:MAG: hypothetical protein LBI11_04260 [Streptococcaceae bacterium]|nr:hypothetical protein [Streptococcaceae bacterium]
MSENEQQQVLSLALESLQVQATLLENQISELAQEIRTLERDDELDKLDAQLRAIRADYAYFQGFVDADFKRASYYD